jgi:hypothetical protein
MVADRFKVSVVERLRHPQKSFAAKPVCLSVQLGDGAVTLLPAGLYVFHISRHCGTYWRLLTMRTMQGRSLGPRLSRRPTEVCLRREMRVSQSEGGGRKFALNSYRTQQTSLARSVLLPHMPSIVSYHARCSHSGLRASRAMAAILLLG